MNGWPTVNSKQQVLEFLQLNELQWLVNVFDVKIVVIERR